MGKAHANCSSCLFDSFVGQMIDQTIGATNSNEIRLNAIDQSSLLMISVKEFSIQHKQTVHTGQSGKLLHFQNF